MHIPFRMNYDILYCYYVELAHPIMTITENEKRLRELSIKW